MPTASLTPAFSNSANGPTPALCHLDEGNKERFWEMVEAHDGMRGLVKHYAACNEGLNQNI